LSLFVSWFYSVCRGLFSSIHCILSWLIASWRNLSPPSSSLTEGGDSMGPRHVPFLPLSFPPLVSESLLIFISANAENGGGPSLFPPHQKTPEATSRCNSTSPSLVRGSQRQGEIPLSPLSEASDSEQTINCRSIPPPPPS